MGRRKPALPVARDLPAERAAFLAHHTRALVALLLVLLPWCIAVSCPFTGMDDPLYVSQNPLVLGGLSFHSIRWAFTTVRGDFWLPMTWLSFMLDATIFGKGPAGFHATNVALHIANCILIYELLRTTTKAPLRSLLVAIFFGIHPLRVESVAWVTERKDVLSAFFGLLAMLAYVRYVKAPKAWPFILATLFFALSLMAKPMLVTLPILLLLFDWWPLNRWRPGHVGRILLEKIPFFVLAAAISAVTYFVQTGHGVYLGGAANPLSTRLENAVLSVGFYLRDTFYFSDLAVYYPRLMVIPPAEFLAAAAVVVAITGAIFWGVRKRRQTFAPVMMGWLWFLVALLPVLGILQSGGQSRADRFTYFPAIGLFVALVWAWPTGWLAKPEQVRMRAGLVAAVTAVLLVSMTVRLLMWRDPLLLYADGIAHTSGNWYLETVMGDTYLGQSKLPEALDHYEKAAAIVPHAGQAQNTVGVVLARMGRLQEAEERFRLAHEASPDDEVYAANYNRARQELDLRRRAGTLPATAGSIQEHP